MDDLTHLYNSIQHPNSQRPKRIVRGVLALPFPIESLQSDCHNCQHNPKAVSKRLPTWRRERRSKVPTILFHPSMAAVLYRPREIRIDQASDERTTPETDCKSGYGGRWTTTDGKSGWKGNGWAQPTPSLVGGQRAGLVCPCCLTASYFLKRRSGLVANSSQARYTVGWIL